MLDHLTLTELIQYINQRGPQTEIEAEMLRRLNALWDMALGEDVEFISFEFVN